MTSHENLRYVVGHDSNGHVSVRFAKADGTTVSESILDIDSALQLSELLLYAIDAATARREKKRA